MTTVRPRLVQRLRRPLCALALGVGVLTVGANAADADAHRAGMPPDLANAIAAYDRATIDNDVVRLDAGQDDYVLVNSDMSVQNKPSYLADFKVPGFRIHRYELRDPILIVRTDSALTGGVFELSWEQEGRSLRRRTRIIHFWEKDAGRWRLAYTQLTRAPDR